MSQELPPQPPTDSPKSAIKRRRRFFSWKIALIVLAVGIASLAWWSRDEPPPDVSDLVFTPLQLPAEQNAYAVLTKAAQLVPEPKWADDEQDTFDAMLKGDAWNDAIAQTCLKAIAPAWPLLCHAEQLSQGQTPWITSCADVFPELSPIMRLGRLAQIRALAEARSGNSDEALRTALIVLSASHRVEESRGGLIHYLTGTAIKSVSLVRIHNIAVNYSPSNEILRTTLRAVSACRASPNALTLAFYSELRTFDSVLPLLKNQGVANTPTHLATLLGHIPLLLKPNQTRRIYADFFRTSSGVIDQPLVVLKMTDAINRFDENHVRGRFPYDPDNAIGRLFLSIVTPNTSKLLKVRLRSQSQISATEAFLALTLYKREHGELPPTLDALVPAYLPAMPRDYFDGAPIRYSRDLGVVWSVGQDNLAITQPDQVVDKREVVLYLTPRPRPTAGASPAP